MSKPTVAEVVARLRAFAAPAPRPAIANVAADLLESEHAARLEAERKLNLANGTIANLMDAGCPYCLTSHEGTSYCTLTEKTIEAETRKREQAERELAELRKRVAEAPRGTVDHYCENAQFDDMTRHGLPEGQRVAIVRIDE